MNEWNSIYIRDSNGRTSLLSNWTYTFADKFHNIKYTPPDQDSSSIIRFADVSTCMFKLNNIVN